MAITSTTEANVVSNNDSIITNHSEEEESDYAYTFQLINFCTLPMVIKVAIDLGVLQIIQDQPSPNGLTSEDIVTKLNLPNPNAVAMLERMLRLLANFSIVTSTIVPLAEGGVQKRYCASRMTKFLVPNDDGVSLAGLLNLIIDPIFLQSWSKLGEATIGGGIPFNMVHGMHAFEYPRVDPRFNEVFNDAMYQTTTFIIKKVLEKYKGLENIEQLVDVGGGLGYTLHAIVSKYPSIKGINFDLPHVIENALPYSGVEHVPGDMFESIPIGDAIFMKWILHDWSDEHCLKLLKNCYKALPQNGKLIIVEATIEDEKEGTNFGRAISLLDVSMMTQNPGGKERSKQEFEALAKEAGFSTLKFDCCIYDFWVMELYK